MTIEFVLLVNRQGQTRLAQYFHFTRADDRAALESEVVRKCLQRGDTECNFIDYLNFRIVYRRYASLFFIIGLATPSAALPEESSQSGHSECTPEVHHDDDEENELAIYEYIQNIVEVLDLYFENVCELDIMFNLERTHFILNEMITNGALSQSTHAGVLEVLSVVDSQTAKAT